ncbi:hypothetical protein E2C01_050139 [Portunus trituberculatus]|uniref:Uncharacterized protein n=1 Tax=Portunus trituberculatus TaxID=210409 RepID=A0A5B7GF32_PORTR|nr:hypothetical protein [Portunus trituberculatus]
MWHWGVLTRFDHLSASPHDPHTHAHPAPPRSDTTAQRDLTPRYT